MPNYTEDIAQHPDTLALEPGAKFYSPEEMVERFGLPDKTTALGVRKLLAEEGVLTLFRHGTQRYPTWNYAVGLTADRQVALAARATPAKQRKRTTLPETTDDTALGLLARLMGKVAAGDVPDGLLTGLELVITLIVGRSSAEVGTIEPGLSVGSPRLAEQGDMHGG